MAPFSEFLAFIDVLGQRQPTALSGFVGALVGAISATFGTYLKHRLDAKLTLRAGLAKWQEEYWLKNGIHKVTAWASECSRLIRDNSDNTYKLAFPEEVVMCGAIFSRPWAEKAQSIHRAFLSASKTGLPTDVPILLSGLQQELLWYTVRLQFSPPTGTLELLWWSMRARIRFDLFRGAGTGRARPKHNLRGAP